jgi:hypothetical protein
MHAGASKVNCASLAATVWKMIDALQVDERTSRRKADLSIWDWKQAVCMVAGG